MTFTLMPIIGARLSGSDSAIGIPPTMALLGRGISAYPVGWLMDRVGRRTGLSLGYLLASIGGILNVLSIARWQSFTGFCIGGLLMGMGRGVIEQTRFIAAEICPPDQQPQKIALMIFAGTIGAVGGPLLVSPTGQLAASFGWYDHIGVYLTAAVFTILAMILIFALLRPDPLAIGQSLAGNLNNRMSEERHLKQIFANGSVRLGVGAMVIGQLVMVLIMIITPLHMNHHAHSLEEISWVIMAHTLGMYGLASLTGRLVSRFGQVPMVIAGALVLAISAILTPISNQMPVLALALFLLGLGWNFCFISGSSLLSEAVAPLERGRALGVNEMMVSLAAGVGSLTTGPVFAGAGLVAVSGLGLAFSLVLLGGATWWTRRETLILSGQK